MKILVISSALPPVKAAEADYALNFCRELVAQSHEVSLLTSRGSVDPGIAHLGFHPKLDRWTWRELPTLAWNLRRLSPDGIVLLYLGWIYSDHPMVTFLPTLAKWLLPKSRVVTVFYNRYGAIRAKATLRSLILQKLLKAASGQSSVIYEYGTLLTSSDRIFALSRQHQTVFKTVYPPVSERLGLLPALPLQRSPLSSKTAARATGRSILKVGPQEFVVAFFGYIYPSKGIETLMQAFKLFQARGNRGQLVLIGGIIEERSGVSESYILELKKLAADLGISDRVVWTGNFESDSGRASEYLYAADLVALPFDQGVSLNNSSLATVAWHGLPTISTSVPHLDAEFRQEENLLLCPPRNPEALADAIERVMRNPELAKKLSEGITELAHNVFSWNKAIHQVTDALLVEPGRLR